MILNKELLLAFAGDNYILSTYDLQNYALQVLMSAMKMKIQIIKLNQVLQHFALGETVGIKFRISDQTQISFYPSSCQLQAALTPRPALH